jgi:hypothetical protein
VVLAQHQRLRTQVQVKMVQHHLLLVQRMVAVVALLVRQEQTVRQVVAVL